MRTSEEERTKNQERIERLIEIIVSTATCRDCDELLQLDPIERDQLIDICGQHGAESIAMARPLGHALWTDDWVVAGYGKQKFGIRRVWTQAQLLRLTADGFLSPDQFHENSAKLLGFNYDATRFDSNTIYSAAKLADWNAAHFPLRQSLEAFGRGVDEKALPVIAGLLIRSVLNEPILQQKHEEFVMTVLDQPRPFRAHCRSDLQRRRESGVRRAGGAAGAGSVGGCADMGATVLTVRREASIRTVGRMKAEG